MTATVPLEDANPRRGVPLIIVGLSLAALAGAFMKQLSVELAVSLIVFWRFSGYFLIMAPVALWRHGRKVLTPPRPVVQILRGVLMGASNACFVTGAQTVNFADAIAILYVYPFLITLFAPFMLGEKVRLISWIGVGGGFLGVLLVIRPSLGGLAAPGAGWILLCGFLVAMNMILNRKLGAVADPILISVWGALGAAGMAAVFALSAWESVSREFIPILVLLAVLAALSQTLVTTAFSRSNAGELAPFTYTEIVSAVAIGFLMFGTLPDMVSWIGMAIIVASGVTVAQVQQGRFTIRRHPKI